MTLCRNNIFLPSFVITLHTHINISPRRQKRIRRLSTVCEIDAQEVEMFGIVDVRQVFEPCPVQRGSVDDPSFAGFSEMSMGFERNRSYYPH
jgi:hypothetical protein